MATMTTQTTDLDDRDYLRDRASMDAERDHYLRLEGEALRRENWDLDSDYYDLSRYDAAYDLQQAEEERQADEDYAYVRDETLAAVETALADWDADEDIAHSVHRVVLALQGTDVLDATLPANALHREINRLLTEFPEEPTEADYEGVFECLHGHGWVHV